MRFSKKILLSFFLVLLCLNACNDGLGSLPELSTGIFKAFKANDFDGLAKLAPSVKSMDKYLELYEYNKYRDPVERNEEAIKRVQELKLLLKLQFDKCYAAIQGSGIEWPKSKLKDFKYEVNDTKEGFHQGIIKLVIGASDKTGNLQCKAVQVKERWFLVPGIEVN